MHRSERLVEHHDIEHVCIENLHVHEHAHSGRIHTLIHARRHVLRDKVAKTCPEQLQPGHHTLESKNWLSICLAYLDEQPYCANYETDKAEIKLDNIEMKRFKPSGGYSARREKQDD